MPVYTHKQNLESKMQNYVQVHSWHQLSCDVEIRDAFLWKRRLIVATHYHQCQARHSDLRKPEKNAVLDIIRTSEAYDI